MTSGHTTSCGCNRKINAQQMGNKQKKQLENKKFDNLLVIKDSNQRRGTEVI